MKQTETGKFTLRANDQVQVIAGRDKGKVGKVVRIYPKANRIVVERVNLVKRHTKPTQQNPGGILEREGSIHFSNVLLYCGKCNRGVRHGFKLEGSGEKQTKVRVCKRCGGNVDRA